MTDTPDQVSACPCGHKLTNHWGNWYGVEGPRRVIVAVSCYRCGVSADVVAHDLNGRPSVIEWRTPDKEAI